MYDTRIYAHTISTSYSSMLYPIHWWIYLWEIYDIILGPVIQNSKYCFPRGKLFIFNTYQFQCALATLYSIVYLFVFLFTCCCHAFFPFFPLFQMAFFSLLHFGVTHWIYLHHIYTFKSKKQVRRKQNNPHRYRFSCLWCICRFFTIVNKRGVFFIRK